MSTSKNKTNVRRLSAEVFGKGNLSIIPELIAPNYVFHRDPEIKGREGLTQYVAMLRTAFPDYYEVIDHIIAEGDMAATFYTVFGTFKGEAMGIPPTGKKLDMPWVVLCRFNKDGKQVEAWQYFDSLTMFRQLGIPIPPQ